MVKLKLLSSREHGVPKNHCTGGAGGWLVNKVGMGMGVVDRESTR